MSFSRTAFSNQMPMLNYKFSNINNTFTLSFSRRFYPKRLTNEDNGSNQNQQKSNEMQVLYQVLVSLTQYTYRIRIESARVGGSNKDGRDVFLADS